VPELTLAQLAQATSGRVLRGDLSTRASSFEIDTRRLREGAAFFALKGQRVDGHQFLGEAASRGARMAIVETAPADDAPAPAALLLVPDVTAALGACGRYVRVHHERARWVALTGSNGKTTTKELIAAGLAAVAPTHRTQGNFNNHLGVPLTLLACPPDAAFVVVEMGMSDHGEIAHLATMVDPDVGLVTNVRAAHLGKLGSLDDIAAAKGELFGVLRPEATSVVNLDDAHVRVQATRHVGPRVTFGQHAAADLHLEEVQSRFLPGAELRFRYRDRSFRVQLHLGGGHSAFNALAALAVVAACGVDLETAIAGMEQLEPGSGRGLVHQLASGIVVVDDSYNSSPSALASVLDTLRMSDVAGRRVLVMGDMLELGRVEGALHREAGKRAAAAGVQVLFAVGPLSRGAAEAARRAGVPEVHQYADSSEAAESIPEFLRPGDFVVVKGSRGMKLERVVQALAASGRGVG
jgi:UDP-N-acetylmuramoyl-tripeptide--D-alanyl-D-alanine ligase